MRSLFAGIKQFLVIACVLQLLAQDIECKKRQHDTSCQSCYDDDECSSCDPCYCGGGGSERSSKKEFKMPKIKMPKLKKSKKSKKQSNDDDDECGQVYSMCPQACPQYCSQTYPQPRCMPPPCCMSQRMPDPCYRPPIQPCCPMPYPRPCPRPCMPPPETRPCFPPMPCSQACPKPCPQACSKPCCSLSCPPPQPCSQACAPCPCRPPCFESTLRSSCDPQASVQKIIVEKGPAIIQNIIFDKEFCEKYFETYGCYPAIDGLPFQLPTQHVTLGNNCDDDDCSTCVNTLPCPPNRNICGPSPCRNDCGRNPCNIPLLSPVSYNKYYPSPCPC